jgi:MFS family permease
MSETNAQVREADDPEYAAHATGTILVSRSIGPIADAVASLIDVVTVPLAGWISDRVGRVPVYRTGALLCRDLTRIPDALHERGQEAVSA